MNTGARILLNTTLAVLGTYFCFLAIAEAKGFLAPLSTAFILALVVVPLSSKLERAGMPRIVASLLNTFLLFLFSIAFMALISFQVKSFVAEWSLIQRTMEPKMEELQTFIFEHTPLTKADFKRYRYNEEGKMPFWDDMNHRKRAIGVFAKTMNFLGIYILTFIYIFFILNYRSRFRKFLLRLFPDERKGKVNKIMKESARVTQQYLIGKLILMALLAVVYSIGLGISGVNNYILISLIAALVTLIPYVGNIIGLALAMGFGYLTSGDFSVLVGVVVTFTVAQFVESYVLQPYIVGDKVGLHPFVVIAVVVAGSALWGVIGMILAIPLMAIITVVFLHISPLEPFGFLFSKKTSSD
ncbi:AI-2E family transporter [Salinimicrobium sp. GXAS 041]|uniref:AI-2E family transporter n=1 Tax=Salinimicrobium sp. GXAS 041 TaxID=3400806 RepID=UPI003C737BBB